MDRTKTFELKGARWQVSKVSALDGSNLIRKFTSSGILDPQEFIANMPDEQFKPIQKILLSSIAELQTINNLEVPIPVVLPNGTIHGIASDDALLLFVLTAVSLEFNLSGFFDEGALKEYRQLMQDFNVPKP